MMNAAAARRRPHSRGGRARRDAARATRGRGRRERGRRGRRARARAGRHRGARRRRRRRRRAQTPGIEPGTSRSSRRVPRRRVGVASATKTFRASPTPRRISLFADLFSPKR
eukprot:31117-Pelagococcus_subviridis.AAC.15